MEGRTALITGSTSGIGLATAHLLASKGCHVILTGSGQRPQSEIDLIKQQFEKYKTRCEYIAADLTKTEKVEELCKTVDQMFPDGIDILINNAGIQHVIPVEEFPLDKWNLMINCMLTAPFILIQHFLPGMKTRGFGRIINMSSVHGVVASPLKSAYCSAKHGLNGLTKVVALEAGGTGVTCNAICPGFVDTPLIQSQIRNYSKEQGLEFHEAKKEYVGKYHPSKETVEEHHIADMCAFLCSASGSQMTGASIMMDGGWSAR